MSGPSTFEKRITVTVTSRALVAEVRDGRLGLDDVALDRGRGRVLAPHVLGEERRVVAAAAVVVRRALEDELAHRRVGLGAGGEDVERARSRCSRARARGVVVGGVDHQPGVDDGVDLGGLHDAPDQRVLIGDAHELGALRARGSGPRESTPTITSTSGMPLERLREPAAPVGGEAGDEYPPALGASAASCQRSPAGAFRRDG